VMTFRIACFAMVLCVSSVGVARAQVFVESRPTWSLTLTASQDEDGELGGESHLIKVRLSSKDFIEMVRDQYESPAGLRIRVTLLRDLEAPLENREILDDLVLLDVAGEDSEPLTFGEIQESNVLGNVLEQHFDDEEVVSEKRVDIGGVGFNAGGLSDNLAMNAVTVTSSALRFRSLAGGEIQGFFFTGRTAELQGNAELEVPDGEFLSDFELPLP
jgi:hypothetical protein